MGRTPVGLLSIIAAPQCLMVKACLRWVNVYPTMRKEEAHHKQEYRGQHGHGDNELLSASLPKPQPMLITALVMGRTAECTQSSGFHSNTGKPAFIFKTRAKESTEKIFEQSIQTPCGLYWRQAAREQLLRMGNEETPAVHWFFLSWAAKMALIYWGTYW